MACSGTSKETPQVSLYQLRKPTTLKGGGGGVLAKIAKIYDPLGVASPLTLCAKLFYRGACNLKVGWDEQLPPNLTEKWVKWESTLPAQITFPRAVVQY